MPKKKLQRTQMVPIRLERYMIQGLDIIAIKQNKYRSELIREAIVDLIQKYDAFEISKKVSSLRAR